MGSYTSKIYYKLVFFVPEPALEACKKAVFATSAGDYPGPGKYTEVCWTAFGTEQFRPGDTADPNIGSRGVLEEVKSVRVEILCSGRNGAKKAVIAMKGAHPYEEPAYEVYRIEDL